MSVLFSVWTPWRLSAAVLVVAAGLPVPVPAPVIAPGPAPLSAQGACVLVFPLPMSAPLGPDFGDPRGRGRAHEGMDLAAPKLMPVFAVAPGTITWMHDERGGRCCDIEMRHDNGWSSRYIHLNNDTPGTDDGQGLGIAEGLRIGSRVETGEVVGWVGDSGNAELVGPHLHFELRDPEGRAVNPREDLQAVMPAEPCRADRHALGQGVGPGREPRLDHAVVADRKRGEAERAHHDGVGARNVHAARH